MTQIPASVQTRNSQYKNVFKCKNIIYSTKLEMCQYDTDAPAQGHPHPHAGILQK